MTPEWLLQLLGLHDHPAEGEVVVVRGQPLVVREGILRVKDPLHTPAQEQTSKVFAFKWHRPKSYESELFRDGVRRWLVERYGPVEDAPWWDELGESPLVVDLGCGGALSATELFGSRMSKIRYLGVDVSDAVEPAASRLQSAGADFGLLQSDLGAVPLPAGTAQVVLAEGVLHHTDSTEAAFHGAAKLLDSGGIFLFYVYNRKGPIREFTDDYVREQLVQLSPEQAWDALRPLTKLGELLADLEVEIEIPEAIDLLQIPAGRISLQRLFYWHVVKAFHRPGLTLEEMNHVNFDWFAPRNCHRQSPEDVRRWCDEADLEILRERVEEAGITVVARRRVA